jgi:hypothetical protein
VYPLTTGGNSSSGGGGGIGAAGVVFCIRIRVGPAAGAYESTTSIPANAVILRAFSDVEDAMGASATLEVGTTADGVSAFMGTGDIDPNIVALYDAPQDTVSMGGVLIATLGGTPNEGALAYVGVEYTVSFS